MKTLEEITKEVNIIKSLTEKTKSGKIEWEMCYISDTGYKTTLKPTNSYVDNISIQINLTNKYTSLVCHQHGNNFIDIDLYVNNNYLNVYGDYKNEIINLIKNLYNEIKRSPKITELSINKIIEKQESMDKATDFLTNL